MIDYGKKSVLGIMVDAVDYDAALTRIFRAARERRPYAVSALAVHGVMTGVESEEHKYRLNSFDLIVPDGQPVRWALNLIHKSALENRVYGPDLTLRTLARAEAEGFAVYFYGTTPEILAGLLRSVKERFPKLVVAGAEPSKFRTLNGDERHELARRITASGAAITMVGLGCPRQEVFAYEMRPLLSMPVLAGAAEAWSGVALSLEGGAAAAVAAVSDSESLLCASAHPAVDRMELRHPRPEAHKRDRLWLGIANCHS
jgi:exopolysaccharide biosynthesis WecB/TagA/CpsF family protein